MYYIWVRKVVATRNNCFAGLYGRQGAALFLKAGAGSTMYGTGHAATHSQLGIGGIYNGHHIGLRGNIALNQFYGDV
jgi:hypothetical protein